MENLSNRTIRPEAEPTTQGTPLVRGKQEQESVNEDKLKFEAEQQKLEQQKLKVEQQKNDLDHNKQNLGWFGKVLGGGDNLTNNIAALVLLMCFVGIFITLCMDNMKLDTAETKKLLFGVIMTTIGFIFGSSKK